MAVNSRPRSLGELIANTRVPDKAIGIFWPGGPSLIFKSALQRIYLVDPSLGSWAGASRMGAIDVKPDLVFCSTDRVAELDVATLTHLAKAFPETRFVGSAEGRDYLIGRRGDLDENDIPVDPERVQALEHETQLDVRQVGVSDRLRIRVLNLAHPSWNVLFGFANVQICLVRHLETEADLENLKSAIRRRIDVLFCVLDHVPLDRVAGLLDMLRPGYAIPLGYDRFPGGRDLARKFRDLVAHTPGVKSYLFAEDYMEGLVYSRIMSRKR